MIEIIEGLPQLVGQSAMVRDGEMEGLPRRADPAMKKERKESLQRPIRFAVYYECELPISGFCVDELDIGYRQCLAGSGSRSSTMLLLWIRLTVQALRFLIPGRRYACSQRSAPEGRAWIHCRRICDERRNCCARLRTLLAQSPASGAIIDPLRAKASQIS